MTKEELEKEARINLKRRFGEFFPQLTISYVMGAEPREKRIAELEAQIEKGKVVEHFEAYGQCRDSRRIAELEYQLTHRNCVDCSNHSSNLRMRNLDLEKENADLKEEINKIAFARGEVEEENAELKHTIATLRQEKDNVSMHAKAMEVVAKTRSDQLTKSKELLERFLNVGDLWELDGNAFLKLQSDVTQFLKDSEVEK